MKVKIKETIIIFLFGMLFTTLSGQDQIILKNDSKIDCGIISINGNIVKYENYRTLRTEIVNTDTIKKLIYKNKVYGQEDLKNKLNKNNSNITITSNTVFLELLGNNTGYSINYDHILTPQNKIKNSIRVGGAFGFKHEQFIQSYIVESSFLFGQNNSHFEIGGGFTYVDWVTKDFLTNNIEFAKFIMLTGRIGYRYQQPGGGFFFNTGFTPLLPVIIIKRVYGTDYNAVLPMIGLGFGYTLKK